MQYHILTLEELSFNNKRWLFVLHRKKSTQYLLLLKSGNSTPLKSNGARYYDTQIHMI